MTPSSPSPAPVPPAPPATSAPRDRRALALGLGALVLACVGTLTYVALLGVPWSRETGLVAFVPLAVASLLAGRAWRADRRPGARVPAVLTWLLAAGFVWLFFVVARLPAPGAFESLTRAPDVALARPEGGKLRLGEAASGGPVLLVFFRGHW